MDALIGLLVFLVFPIIFFIVAGVFFQKNKVSGDSKSLGDALENFKKSFPGSKGKIVYWGITLLFLLAVGLRIFNLIKGY